MEGNREQVGFKVVRALGTEAKVALAEATATYEKARAERAKALLDREKLRTTRARKAERAREALALYGHVNANFRKLTDIRFKLLTFLPLATGLAVFTKVGPEHWEVSLFAAVVTVALWAYDQRNDQLYDELVGQAAELERDMGRAGGPFDGRPGRWWRIGCGLRIEHRWPVKLIYGASLALWLSNGLIGLVTALYRDASEHKTAIPLVVTLSVITLVWRLAHVVYRSGETQEDALRSKVREAHMLLRNGFQRGETEWKGLACELAGKLTIDKKTVEHRLEYHVAQFTPLERTKDPDKVAARILAQIIDMPPRSILDIQGRRWAPGAAELTESRSPEPLAPGRG